MFKQSLLFFSKLTCLFALATSAMAQGNLTVQFGTSGLQNTVGATNDVWSNVPATGMVFDHWNGDTTVLTDPLAWHSKALMPSSAKIVTAIYKSAPVWTYASTVLNGKASTDPKAIHLIYHFPTNPIGVIFFFHGAGGSAVSFFTKVESLSFAREAVAAGYAVAALDSYNRTSKDWSNLTTSSNPDIQDVQASITYLIGQGLMTTSTGKYASGMSSGGAFAPKPAYQLGFRGCAIWCAAGSPIALFASTTVPTIWSLAKYDDQSVHTTTLKNATTNKTKLTNRGIAAALTEYPSSAVYPGRFQRIAGLTSTDSQTIYNMLKNGGYLDANNYLLADPVTSNWTSVMPTSYHAYQQEIQSQLNVCYTEHELFSDADGQILKFFKAHP